MLVLVQWVGLTGSLNLNATSWAVEEKPVNSSAVSEAESKKLSAEESDLEKSKLIDSAASEEVPPTTANKTESSSTAASLKPLSAAVSKEQTAAIPTTEKANSSTADQVLIESSVVSEPAGSPIKVTENLDLSTAESQKPTDASVASEESADLSADSTKVKDLSVTATGKLVDSSVTNTADSTKVKDLLVTATGKLVGSSVTNTEPSVDSPTTVQQEATAQTISQATPDSAASTPAATSQPDVSTTTETTEPEAAPAPTSIPAPVKKPVTSKTNSTNNGEAYIDRTDYSVGATQTKRNAVNRPSVVLSERSTGCQTVLSAGQGVTGSLCGSRKNPALKGVTSNSPKATLSPLTSASLIKMGTLSSSGMIPTTKIPRTGLSRSVVSSIPLGRSLASSSGAGLGNFTAGLSNYSNIKVAKWFVPSNTRIIFPLAIPVAITSAFGWRLHPISGTWRFHSGTDLGAPIGTPVLAASAGRVAIANFLGGYGLTVVLEHNKGTQESLYGHLSGVTVQPGALVKQGDVIGLVGSTGNSTGPHLHFEVRQSTPQGWVAVDPGQQLETALAQLVRALQTAQAPNPRSGT